MGVVERHSMLTGFKVGEAMRRQVISLLDSESIDKAISYLIKYKISAILLTDGDGKPTGVVSKTDIMAAYYAGFPLDQDLRSISATSPITCTEADPLEEAMEKMRQNRIYRLYVYDQALDHIVGLLAYPDIVGLLYRLCHNCERNYLFKKDAVEKGEAIRRFKVKEVMTKSVQCHRASETLYTLMETLSKYRFGAVLIKDDSENPVGVVSKTDLISAYKHQINPETPASEVMSKKVHGCSMEAYLTEAIQQMIFSDIHRLFVYQDHPVNIVGVLSFTDAARLRSGSCRACLTTRIKIEDQGI